MVAPVRSGRDSYFNPRTCTRCDNHPFLMWCSTGIISIHAPARGAIKAKHYVEMLIEISIHAPARGAIRPHGTLGQDFRISIHAPARGAISLRLRISFVLTYFNPRTCTRCDLSVVREELGSDYFNPRTCTRCDYGFGVFECRLSISIHAPARGAIDDHFVFPSLANYFNPRTCTRCDLIAGGVRSVVSYFNPRTCTRCDQTQPTSFHILQNFNPRTCTRCDTL